MEDQNHHVLLKTELNNCTFCEKKFSTKSNLNKHLKVVHKTESKSEKLNIICPLCKATVINYSLLRKHVAETHNVTIETEELTFQIQEDFYAWKEKIEKDERASYTLQQTKRLPNDNKKTYFTCHRSGTFVSKSKGKRALKAQGSCKMDSHCPSTIEAVETENIITVIHYKTHVGHDMELKHLALSQEEKTVLANKIAAGISEEKILDEVRSSVTSDIDRIHLLTRQDLRNIADKNNLAKTERRHDNDSVSVQLFVQEMEGRGEHNPVLFFKNQGEVAEDLNVKDFMLVLMTPVQKDMFLKFSSNKICIDSTHGTNAYDFQLTTIVVVDEFNQGFPVAFCISNHVNATHMVKFFEEIKKNTCSVTPKVFMSDDAPAYYNAWVQVMGEPIHKLLCIWHVIKNWKQSLCKIKCMDKRASVYKYLRTLLEEIDENQFNVLLESFLEDLLMDLDTRSFHEYFSEYYARRCKEWAYCFRIHDGITTNMYLESLHKVLKHVYMNGKVNKRIDSCIDMLLKVVKDKAFERFIKLVKGCTSKRMTEIHKRHKKALEIKSVVKVDSKSWTVKSETNCNIQYIITKIDDCVKCDLICRMCGTCVHNYSCTCIDCIVCGNMCKHIHAVSLETSNTCQITSANNSIQNIKEITSSEGFASLAKNEKQDSGNLAIEAKINFALSLLKKKTVSSTQQQALHKHLDKVIDVLKDDSQLMTTSIEPPNKKIHLQPRFYSTKKKKTCKAVISKPSSSYKSELKYSVNNKCEQLNIHDGFDHSYT